MAVNLRVIGAVIRQYRAYRKFSALPEESKLQSKIPQQFVEEILALGPAFIKLGQVLSTRPDFMPAQYLAALESLQEHVPPLPFETIKLAIEKELNKPLNELFREFSEVPAASASLSQVHYATLASGAEVAVKVQRPGLPEQVRRDLNVLGQLVRVAGLFFRTLYRNLNVLRLFDEFRRYTLQELDFLLEGRTYERFEENFRNDDSVRFPKIYWEYSTAKILTMQKMAGLRLHEVTARTPVNQRQQLASNVVNILINMFVRDGFFHADLHPGNIFFHEHGSVALIDVGMFGELTQEQRERFILYWLAITLKEKERAFYHLLKLTNRTDRADEAGFYREYSRLLDGFYRSSIQERSLTQTYLEILVLGAKRGFIFPPEMLLQAKALTTAEYIGLVLVPDFNFAEAAKPIVTRAFTERLSSDNVSTRIALTWPEWLLLGESGPGQLLNNDSPDDFLLEKAGEQIAEKWDRYHDGEYQELWHGENWVDIDCSLETVFNFVTRLAQYPLWHPTYTDDSHVIHVSGEYVFITPDVIGSVFRLDEIVDGYHLLSNGIVVEFERNKVFKWKAPFSMLLFIELGTCFQFQRLENGKTRLSEYFFFSESPVKHIFANRKWFSVEALSHHIKEELGGVKNLLESGHYAAGDVQFLWEDLDHPVRFLDGQAYEVEHLNDAPMPFLRK